MVLLVRHIFDVIFIKWLVCITVETWHRQEETWHRQEEKEGRLYCVSFCIGLVNEYISDRAKIINF